MQQQLVGALGLVSLNDIAAAFALRTHLFCFLRFCFASLLLGFKQLAFFSFTRAGDYYNR